MSKGTASFGKKNKINHLTCVRCGSVSFHKRKQKCAACAYPEPKWKRNISDKTQEKKNKPSRRRHLNKTLKSKRSGFKGNKIINDAMKN